MLIQGSEPVARVPLGAERTKKSDLRIPIMVRRDDDHQAR
jgi:hypothetical protein